MEFAFETEYGQKATTAMARVLRKTLRKKHSRRSHLLGWIVMILALLFVLPIGDKEFVFDSGTILNCIVIVVLFFVLLFEDSLNGYIARKRMLKGTEKAKTTFRDDGFFSETEIGNTQWQYDKIEIIAETRDYFVFIFSPSHAQLHDKNNLTGGTAEEFRKFIMNKTGKDLIFVQ